jgi:hypothetical protein
MSQRTVRRHHCDHCTVDARAVLALVEAQNLSHLADPSSDDQRSLRIHLFILTIVIIIILIERKSFVATPPQTPLQKNFRSDHIV